MEHEQHCNSPSSQGSVLLCGSDLILRLHILCGLDCSQRSGDLIKPTALRIWIIRYITSGDLNNFTS